MSSRHDLVVEAKSTVAPGSEGINRSS